MLLSQPDGLEQFLPMGEKSLHFFQCNYLGLEVLTFSKTSVVPPWKTMLSVDISCKCNLPTCTLKLSNHLIEYLYLEDPSDYILYNNIYLVFLGY